MFRRVDKFLDFLAMGLGIAAFGWLLIMWGTAMSDDKYVVNVYVNQYGEGWQEIVVFSVVIVFITWRWLTFWWRMFRGDPANRGISRES